jgi:hypothetical protein
VVNIENDRFETNRSEVYAEQLKSAITISKEYDIHQRSIDECESDRTARERLKIHCAHAEWAQYSLSD